MSDTKHMNGDLSVGEVRRPMTAAGLEYHTCDIRIDDDKCIVIHMEGAGSRAGVLGMADYLVRAVNAHPDLLTACELALNLGTQAFGVKSAIRSAIAKTKGEA